ncbi:predicted protein [Sclerotinia sclerotiorum 1980 UF-70]|uniref:Uncharacterized protein n=1 Tax=Sclerotinia sclerotiorum (strain ATCC 18683 / 1980 / Ss-1) TaxID=665079 RepID=A7EJ54_SCLS1|nr:predicted protein [Sclerotinia sclerotiorum 1980 UF-70]EDO02870.1 predicted protein [Sclerotinia sclerotiorum 1980 UF-70]
MDSLVRERGSEGARFESRSPAPSLQCWNTKVTNLHIIMAITSVPAWTPSYNTTRGP